MPLYNLEEVLNYYKDEKDFNEIKISKLSELFVKNFTSFKEIKEYLIQNGKEDYLKYDVIKMTFTQNKVMIFI